MGIKMIRIHDKYLLKRFLRIFLFSMIAFTIIYVTIDLFEELDNFIDKKARLEQVFQYYFYSAPFIITYVTPVSLLLASIFSMGALARRNELTAMISAGISLTRISLPLLLTASAISAGVIFFNDAVVTKSNRERLKIKHFDIEGRRRDNPHSKENLHYLGRDGIVFLAGKYDHRNRILHDVVLQEFEHNTLVRRIDAKRSVWDGDHWVFFKGFNRTFAADSERVNAFESLSVDGLDETPDDFAKEEIDEENMSMSELREYIERVRKSGGAVESYMVDFYFKFSFPFAGAIFVLLGISFTSGKRKQSVATGFGVTLLISFIYYGILRAGRTLGQNGVLEPFLAAQMGNMAFLILGAFLLRKANR